MQSAVAGCQGGPNEGEEDGNGGSIKREGGRGSMVEDHEVVLKPGRDDAPTSTQVERGGHPDTGKSSAKGGKTAENLFNKVSNASPLINCEF